MKKIFTLIAAVMMVASVNAQDRKWDFTNWSDATIANLKADKDASQKESWSDCEKQDKSTGEPTVAEATSEKCYWNAGDAEISGELKANGTVIAETAGLEFYAATSRGVLAIAVDYASTSIGNYKGAKYLWLGKNTTYFTIKDVKPGSTIKMGVESHKNLEGNSQARGVQLSIDGTNLDAAFEPIAYEEHSWTVPAGDANVSVKVQATNGCHIYFVEVTEGTAGINAVSSNNVTAPSKSVKNGQLVISKNGRQYNAAGALLK